MFSKTEMDTSRVYGTSIPTVKEIFRIICLWNEVAEQQENQM